MKKRDVYLKDIQESINKIEMYTHGIDYDSFCFNEMMFDAVIRNLEVMGEAARNAPDEIKTKYPDIPWRQMIGLRNILIHEYFGIDNTIVWQIIKTNLPEIKPIIMKAIQEERDIT
jgi:uncharacterized protein with HEPN domain